MSLSKPFTGSVPSILDVRDLALAHAYRNFFLSSPHSTLCLDGARRPGDKARCHPFSLPRLDGSLRARTLGVWKDCTFDCFRARLWESPRRQRIVGTIC